MDIYGTHTASNSAYIGLYRANGKYHDTNTVAKYVILPGAAKNLYLRVRQAFHTANTSQGEDDLSKLRLIVDYMISII